MTEADTMHRDTHAPVLILVTGRPGSGKSSLAHRVAETLGCSVVARDEIYEGGRLAALFTGRPASDQDLSATAFDSFFAIINLLLTAGSVCVAEAAFQHEKWCEGLASINPKTRFVHVHCDVCAEIARSRVYERRKLKYLANTEQPELSLLAVAPKPPTPRHHEQLRLRCPSITVLTADGYDPVLSRILRFIVDHAQS